MRVEVRVRVTETEGYSTTTVAESDRTLLIDDDPCAARKVVEDLAAESVDDVTDRLRLLARRAAEGEDDE